MLINFNDYSNNEESQAVVLTGILPGDDLVHDQVHDIDNNSNATQDDLSLPTDNNNYLWEQLNALAVKMDIDPWSHRILCDAQKVLLERTKFSIEQLIEAMGEHEESLLKEATLRKKLNGLVERGLLQSIPGQGRTPTYYFLPDPQSITKLFSDNQVKSFEQDSDEVIALKTTLSIYEKKRQLLLEEIEEKQSWLKKAEVDIDCYKTVIKSIEKELNLLIES